ncbi:hypothetical protein FEM48_Zijuj12G0092700 [Ziziphus jujuba var. spinosa]|uniref:Uncharacterized protein n=1 Tax=Ziziphus jujuba var. spinosa TaxID=714518 RepID=A0A978UCG3_ZIZJJ|nr:hypothetical protein FEM48_Zijuj12G0092700 [Ziziphus jujuba var. spinosa]
MEREREREREREVNLVKDKGLAKAKRRRDADDGGGDEPQPSSGKRPKIVETKPSQPSNKMNLFRNGVSDEELLLELQAAVDQKVAALMNLFREEVSDKELCLELQSGVEKNSAVLFIMEGPRKTYIKEARKASMEEKARKGYLKEACKANIEEVHKPYMEEVREACMNFQRPRIYASSIILALKAWELVPKE